MSKNEKHEEIISYLYELSENLPNEVYCKLRQIPRDHRDRLRAEFFFSCLIDALAETLEIEQAIRKGERVVG